MDLGLKDATAVVVGGGRGMGFAAAQCLADDGARVALIGRTKTLLDEAAKELSDCGSPDALGLAADTNDADQVRRVFDEIGTRWNGELNMLINAVGPGTRGTFEDLTDEQWREAFDDGVMGMVHCVRSALPQLRKADWARIVNFSAHSTQRQTVILPAYTAAKAAVTSISKNLSLLLAKDEIMVNVVSPGSIAPKPCAAGPNQSASTATTLTRSWLRLTSTSGIRHTCPGPACRAKSGPSWRFSRHDATHT